MAKSKKSKKSVTKVAEAADPREGFVRLKKPAKKSKKPAAKLAEAADPAEGFVRLKKPAKKGKKRVTNKKEAAADPGPSKPAAKSRSDAPTLSKYYADTLSAISTKLRISSGSGTYMDPISTGFLCIDRVMGGGAKTVMSIISGQEQSGKSTLTLSIMASAVKAGVPLILYNDPETTVSPEFVRDTMGKNIGDVFGGPGVVYQQNSNLDAFTSQMKRMAAAMPDKSWVPALGQWAYFVPKGLKTTKSLTERLEGVGLKPLRGASASKYEGSWVFPTDYSGPEAAVFLDSWPNMLPANMVEEMDPSAGMAVQARAFSQALPHFIGSLRTKGIVMSTVNQLRAQPMNPYQPWIEPGGNRLLFDSAFRARIFSRAVPKEFERDENRRGLCREPSASHSGGFDLYAFKFFEGTKSKVGPPLLSTRFRVWVSDAVGTPRGIDPVFDTYEYLMTSGQMSGPAKKLVIKLRASPTNKITPTLAKLTSKPVAYQTLKSLVVAEHFGDRDLLKKVMAQLGLKNPPRLREWLANQVRQDTSVWNNQDLGGSTTSGKEEEEADGDA